VRVALYIGQLDVGGAEGQLLMLAAGLAARGDDVLVITEEGRTAALPADLASLVRTVPGRPRGARRRALRDALAAFAPDVLHCQLTSANLWGTLARAQLRLRPALVISFLSTDPWKRWYHLALDRRLAARADGVLCNSRLVAARYAPVLGKAAAKITVIYNGVDAERFDAARYAGERALLREEVWRVPAAAAVVVNVANLYPVKNHGLLLRALARVHREREAGARPYLVLCGDGPAKQDLLWQAGELGVLPYLRLVGRVGDVERHLAAADIFALSSDAEGFSNALLEAMASGLACVATAVGGNAEALAEDAGVVVPPRDGEALAAALAALADDGVKRRALGERARARAVSAFGRERMVAETRAWYEELVRRRARY
jgi:glycosyltransferase involved in cell wall biosynthesis